MRSGSLLMSLRIALLVSEFLISCRGRGPVSEREVGEAEHPVEPVAHRLRIRVRLQVEHDPPGELGQRGRAEVGRHAGRHAEAHAALEQAIALADQKGSVLAAERAREELASLSS